MLVLEVRGSSFISVVWGFQLLVNQVKVSCVFIVLALDVLGLLTVIIFNDQRGSTLFVSMYISFP
jgi:hypothetical protein